MRGAVEDHVLGEDVGAVVGIGAQRARRRQARLGFDDDGQPWQTAIVIDHVTLATGAEAKAADTAGVTPVPPCCADDQPVMIIYLQSMFLPQTVTSLATAFLHRKFLGFGARSVVTRTILPAAVDPETTDAVQLGAQTYHPRRDAELEAACRVVDDLLPKVTS